LSIADIYSRLNLGEATPAQVSAVYAAIDAAYATISGKALLEQIVSKNLTINVKDNTGQGNHADRSTDTFYIDLELLTHGNVVDEEGFVRKVTATEIVVHELIHIIRDERDPELPNYTDSGNDYVGDVVREEQTILEEIGGPVRASYYASLDDRVFNEVGATYEKSLTDGNNVSTVIVDGEVKNAIDVSWKTDNALILGLNQADTITGTQGDDYIYGGSGDDVLMGELGRDVINGNEGRDILVGHRRAPTKVSEVDMKVSHSDWSVGMGDLLIGGNGRDNYFTHIYEGATWDWAFLYEFNNDKALELLKIINTVDESSGDGMGGIWLQVESPSTMAVTQLVVGGDYSFSYVDEFGTIFYSSEVGIDLAYYEVTEASGETVPYLFAMGGYPSSPLLAIRNFYQDDFGIHIDGFTRARAGNDVLPTGPDSGALDGGSGIDTADYSGSDASLDINLAAGTSHGGYAEADTHISIENITGSAFADTIVGTEEGNILRGGQGNDMLDGNGGDDSLIGGDGDDILKFGALGEGWAEGGEGNDTIVLQGHSTDFRISVISQSTIQLFSADAVFTVSSAENLQFDDTVVGVADIMLGEFGDTFFGTGGSDNITGSIGPDFIMAFEGNDVLAGREKNDTIYAGSGNDVLDGGTGDDELNGESGNDVFIFRAGFAHDTVTDFTAGIGNGDVIDVSTDLFADFASILAAASQVGDDTIITYDAGNSITLKNVTLTSLHQDDFRFTTAA